MTDSKAFLHKLQLAIECHLHEIELLVGSKYKLTLVARYTKDDLPHADIVLTVDDLDKAIEAIHKIKTVQPL